MSKHIKTQKAEQLELQFDKVENDFDWLFQPISIDTKWVSQYITKKLGDKQ